MLALAHAGITLGVAVLVAGGLKKSDLSKKIENGAVELPHRFPRQALSPPAHPVQRASTWLTALGKSIDIRLLFIGSLLPDIIDKPLGHLFFREALSNGRVFGHSLIFFIIIALVGLLVILLTLTACTSKVTVTSTTSTTKTITQTISEPAVTITVTETVTSTLKDQLKVHFIDVGQGDAILIDLNETEILIDGGGKSPGVVTYINDYIDGTLEVMVATHPHADHIGGLIEILNNFQVAQIWHNGDTSTSKTYSEFMMAVQTEGAAIHIAKRGDHINADELTFLVFNPYVLGDDTNNNSIVLSLSYGDIDFLFTGDTEQEAENEMLVQSIVPLPDVEILKVGHHGSRTASSEYFLEFVSPEIAIYMAGVDNSYGHPHEETILALSNINADIYGTDVFGTIVVTTDGVTYEVQTGTD